MRRRFAVASLVGLGLAPGLTAHAAGEPGVGFAADAFRTPFGPMIRFSELGAAPDANAPVVRTMRVTRPREVGVAAPPRGRTLGGLIFFVGPRTCPTCADRRSVELRRRASLGDGDYLVGRGFGARVKLSTTQRSRFLRVSLPRKARNVQLTLTRSGSRLLRFTTCGRVTFAVRFSLYTGVAQDTEGISGARLRRAGLC
jgi:hypothetical protein